MFVCTYVHISGPNNRKFGGKISLPSLDNRTFCSVIEGNETFGYRGKKLFGYRGKFPSITDHFVRLWRELVLFTFPSITERFVGLSRDISFGYRVRKTFGYRGSRLSREENVRLPS